MVLSSYFNKKLIIPIVTCALFWSQVTWADTIFEGYFKILMGSKHIGYVIQRYGFDAKKKQFTSTYYIKTGPVAGNANESLRAVANDRFQPVSYQYTFKSDQGLKVIDAKFKKGRMMAVVSDGKQKNNINKKLNKGTFLSTFLGYLMLNNGFKKGKKFSYYGIAEEEAEAFSGTAIIKGSQKTLGLDTFLVHNTFKGTKFTSIVAPDGGVIRTNSPKQNISTQLVAAPKLATKGFQLPTATLKKLFGNVPIGKNNPLSKNLPKEKGVDVDKVLPNSKKQPNSTDK